MLPRDTNAHGTIFGGVILSGIDQAGAVPCFRLGCRKVVTVAMDQVEFHQPVNVGDLVSFYTRIIRAGRTSITVRVSVEAEGRTGAGPIAVTSADVTYVHVDEAGRPIPLPA
jgi:acyl-CoA thioesterase YciA